MWPGLVGKVEGTSESPISLDRMLELTADAKVGDRGFDGVDIFLDEPHLNIDADQDEVLSLADKIAAKGLKVGTVVAPIWRDANGGSAMGSEDERGRFIAAVEKACKYAAVLRAHGVRSYGNIRIDAATSVEEWAADPVNGTMLIAQTFREAGVIAEGYGERLVAEGEICWGGMHTWKEMLKLLEAVDMPGSVGFQADLAHTYLYMLGYNTDQGALLTADHSDRQFWDAYKTMSDALRPWTYDFHVAQSDGSVHGSGTHDRTGRHCKADDPNGKLDIARCAEYWLLDEYGERRSEIEHICWDGCMFSNADLEQQSTWNTVLAAMIDVDAISKNSKKEVTV